MHHLVFGDDVTSVPSPLTRHRSPATMPLHAPSSATPKPWEATAALQSIMRSPQPGDGPSCRNPSCSATGKPLSTAMIDVGAVCTSCGQVVVSQRIDDTIAGTTGKLARDDDGYAIDDCHANPWEAGPEDVETLAPVVATIGFGDVDVDDDSGAGAGAGAGLSMLPSEAERKAMRTVLRKRAGSKLNVARLNSTVSRRRAVASRKKEITTTAIRDITIVVMRMLAVQSDILVVGEAKDVLAKLKSEVAGWTDEKVVDSVATGMLRLTFQSTAADRYQATMNTLLRDNDMFHVYVAIAFFVLAQKTAFDNGAFTTVADSVKETMRTKGVAGTLSPQRTSLASAIPTTKKKKKMDDDEGTVLTTAMFGIIVSCVSIITKRLEGEHKFSTTVAVAKRKAAAATMAKLAASPPPRPSPAVVVETVPEEKKKKKKRRPAKSGQRKKRCTDGAGAGAGAGVDARPLRHWDLEYSPVSELTSSCGWTNGSTQRHYTTVTLPMVTIVAPWFPITPVMHNVTLSVLGTKIPPLFRILQETDKLLGGLAAETPLVKACGGSLNSPIHLVVLKVLWSIISSCDIGSTDNTTFGRVVMLYYTLVVPKGAVLPKEATIAQSTNDRRRKAKDRTCIFDARPIMFSVLDAISTVVNRKIPTIVSKVRDAVVAMEKLPDEGTHTEFVSGVLPSLSTWFTLSHKRTTHRS